MFFIGKNETDNNKLYVMGNERFLSTFCALTLIVISTTVLYVAWTSSPLTHKQGWNSVLGTISQYSASREESIQAMNLERQATIREFCKRNNRTNETVDTKKLDNIIVDEKFKLLFCYIPKVSCSQLKTIMASLNGTLSKYQIHDARNFKFLNAYPRDEADKMLKSHFKFVFVREPFERLLSAYLDKFYSGDRAFHKKYALEILRKYRPGVEPVDKNITFDEFLNYVVSIGDGYWNEHWKTYDKLCRPCGVHYDFIGRFENLEEEAHHVLKTSGISKKMNVSFPEVRPSTTSSKIPFFYSQIPKERLHKVLQIFGKDSEMFGYDLPNYFYDSLASHP